MDMDAGMYALSLIDLKLAASAAVVASRWARLS